MKIWFSLMLLFLCFCKSRTHNEQSKVQNFDSGQNRSPTGINLPINSQEFRVCGLAFRDCLWTNVDSPSSLTDEQRWDKQRECIARNCNLGFILESTNKVCFLEGFNKYLASDLGAFSMWDNLCTTNFNPVDPYSPTREWKAKVDAFKAAIGTEPVYCSSAAISKLHSIVKNQNSQPNVEYSHFKGVVEGIDFDNKGFKFCQKTPAKSHNYKCPKFNLAMCLSKRFPPDNRLIGGDCINIPPHNKCQMIDPKSIQGP